MPCFHPMPGWRSRIPNPKTGKFGVIMGRRGGQSHSSGPGQKLTLPCGQCHGCRLERSRQWAIRCVHEAKQYERNCFVTLTTKDKFLRTDTKGRPTLQKRDVQLFIKRLRKKFGKGIRYYYCGEYGDKYGRPHYHLCLFNFDFSDKAQTETTTAGHALYESETLNTLWSDPKTKENYGKANIGELTFETAAYVARYILKKLTGKRKHEYDGRQEEFTDMSRKPGIANEWYQTHKTDVWNTESVIIDGREIKPPKYYYRQFEKEYPEDYAKLKNKNEIKTAKKIDRENKKAHKNLAEMVEANKTKHETLKAKTIHAKITTKKNLIRRYENESI